MLVILPICRRSLAKEFQTGIFYVANKPIEHVKSFLHIGHWFISEFNDDEDIINGLSNFVRYTNNSLCYFRKLHLFVEYKLFQAYCTSLYVCDFWLLTDCNIDALCVACRKRAWNLHGIYLLHDSLLVRFVAQYVICAHSQSILGQNVLFCAQRYHRSVSDVIIRLYKIRLIVVLMHLLIIIPLITRCTWRQTCLQSYLNMWRDHVFCFSNDFSLSHGELNDIINYIFFKLMTLIYLHTFI